MPSPNLSNFDIDILAHVETVGMDVKVTEGSIEVSSRCVDAQRSTFNTERSYQVSFIHVHRMRFIQTP